MPHVPHCLAAAAQSVLRTLGSRVSSIYDGQSFNTIVCCYSTCDNRASVRYTASAHPHAQNAIAQRTGVCSLRLAMRHGIATHYHCRNIVGHMLTLFDETEWFAGEHWHCAVFDVDSL
jgi:hypothetical protein